MKYLKLLIIFIYLIPNTQAQFWDETAKLEASDTELVWNFGEAVAISGEYAIVSKHGRRSIIGFPDTIAFEAAYIFKRKPDATWEQIQKLAASDREGNTIVEPPSFGYAVAISGNYAVVTAAHESRDASATHPLRGAGAAYVLERDASGHWAEVQKIVASDRGKFDLFGFSASISGSTIVIGARNEGKKPDGSPAASFSGAAYIFERNQYGRWEERQKIVASTRGHLDMFGNSVSISGGLIVVGAIGTRSPVYIFERNATGYWNEIQIITSSDRDFYSDFGVSVCVNGDYIIVGAADESKDTFGGDVLHNAGAAYIFERDARGHWHRTQKLVASDRSMLDGFGGAVAISCGYAVVGAAFEGEDGQANNSLSISGSAYVFRRNQAGQWEEMQKIVASDRASEDLFGATVAISKNRILIGAAEHDNPTSTGSAYIFDSPQNPTCPREEANTAFIPYPNPNEGELCIELKRHYHSVEVSVHDVLGRDIFAQKFYDSSQIRLQFEGQAGIYLLDIRTEGKSETLKVVKR